MPNSILFARIAPSELSIITTENNNIIDLGWLSNKRPRYWR